MTYTIPNIAFDELKFFISQSEELTKQVQLMYQEDVQQRMQYNIILNNIDIVYKQMVKLSKQSKCALQATMNEVAEEIRRYISTYSQIKGVSKTILMSRSINDEQLDPDYDIMVKQIDELKKSLETLRKYFRNTDNLESPSINPKSENMMQLSAILQSYESPRANLNTSLSLVEKNEIKELKEEVARLKQQLVKEKTERELFEFNITKLVQNIMTELKGKKEQEEQ
ncbi:Hypothetical_protein [Hexamita inflata]|uniref:Hypothetical_protein n=1 Tax=Hexamita inflata TaxID=28002 RepID=A0AA86RGE0_9EUKA|nr:Hypothetical protein HINF_LOCUS63657 [Hexamita inflata]